MGVQLARTRRRWQAQTSENDSRVNRQLADETTARQAIATLRLDLNHGEAWLKTRSTAVSELAAHYRERELEPDTIWKTHSTKVTYEGYLNKWILPRWGKYPLVRVNAGEVEL